ncbi:MAG TPA: hypothetical protein VKW78_06410 [Terriglobales bacterium]|nr:hypothetical protein [Terriglobales bacterium]
MLSAIVALVSAIASIIGLRFPGVYGSSGWGNGTSLGNDLITLLVAVPTLAVSIIYSIHGSVRARPRRGRRAPLHVLQLCFYKLLGVGVWVRVDRPTASCYSPYPDLNARGL